VSIVIERLMVVTPSVKSIAIVVVARRRPALRDRRGLLLL
jgi:hypothetical protein